MSCESFLFRPTFHVGRTLKMSGEGPVVRRSKCPAKLKIISRTRCLTLYHYSLTLMFIIGAAKAAVESELNALPQSVFTVKDIRPMTLDEKEFFTVSITDAPSPTDISVQVVTEENITNTSVIETMLTQLFGEYSG